MSQDIKEIQVGAGDLFKKIQYQIKDILLKDDSVIVVAGTGAAINTARTCETLVRLNYVTYGDIRTETSIVNNRRKTNVIIKLNKTSQFQKLYDENEATRKRKQAEREEQQSKQTSN